MSIWKQIKLYIKAPQVYIDTPICENHSFIPGLNDIVFSTWKHKGVCNIKDLYIDGNFATFARPLITSQPQVFSDIYKLEIMSGNTYQTLKF